MGCTRSARRLSGEWPAARDLPRVTRLIADALNDPETRLQGIAMAAATRDGRYRAILEGFAGDARLPVEARVAAVEAIGSFRITPNRVPEQLVAAVRGKPSSDPVAEAAIRAMASTPALGSAGRYPDRAATTRWACAARRCGAWPAQDGGSA